MNFQTQADFSSAYDSTKYQAQQLVDQFAEQGLPSSAFSFRNFWSDDPHFGPVLQQFQRTPEAVGWRRSHYRRCPRGRLSRCHDSGSRKGKPGEHYIISAGDLTTREMFKILERETGIPVREAPKPC